MGIGVGVFLIAAGAILTWGVTADAEGLNVDAIGVILMVVGVVGIVISAVFWSSWGGYGVRQRTVVRDIGSVERPSRTTRIVDERDDAPLA
jgi:hypothetical protein